MPPSGKDMLTADCPVLGMDSRKQRERTTSATRESDASRRPKHL